MRPISYDLSCLLSTPGLFVDPNDKDDDLPDQYLFNESNIDFNDKDEPFEGPKIIPTLQIVTSHTIIQMIKLGP